MSTETTPGPGATGGDDTERPTRARGGDGASAPTSSSTASTTASTDGHSAAAGNGRTAVLDPPEGEAAVVTAPVAGGAASPAAPPAPPPGSSLARKATPWGISLVVLVAGMFMSVLDISIVNVATPRMQNDFGVTLEDIQWVSTAYSLAEGVIVPASAWLGLKFGLGRSYMWALVLFTIASALCGLAWDLNSMIAFRVIQAIPGGVIPVVALTMLYKVVPKEKIGSAMGLYGLGIVVAPGIGPTLGGYLVEYVNWRLIFFINIPIGVIGVLAAWYYLPKFASAKAHRFDTKGFLAIATGLFALLVALHEGEEWGWTSPAVLGLALYGVLAIAMFVVIELEVKHPLLNVRIFTTWAYTNSLIIIGVVMMGMFGVLFFIPQSLQQNQGLGAFETGLVLLPQAIAMAVIMPIAGLLYDRIGARWPAMIGLSICTYGTWLLHDVTINTSHSELAWILAMRAAGVALAMMPIMTGGMSSLSPDLVGGASAFNTVVQRSSSAIGLAGLTAVMTGFQSQFFADRTAVMPANGAAATSGSIAEDGGSAGGSMLEMYSMNAQVQTQVFDTAFSNLMILTTALTALSVVLAFFLPGGKPAPGGATHVEM